MTLELIAFDKHWARVIAAEGSASLQASCSNFVTIAPFLEDAIDALIAMHEHRMNGAPWTAYLVRDKAAREIVGLGSLSECGDGTVAIAFHTFPPCEGRGFGKETAATLVEMAFRSRGVREAIAHTRPHDSAAAAIMRALDFVHAKTVTDSVRGLRWQWSLARPHTGDSTKGTFVPMLRAGVITSLLMA